MDVGHLGLLLSLVWNSCALPPRARKPLSIHPKDPLVEVGGSIQLHCSLDCPGGKVQWEGLDIDLANVISNDTSSTLTVTNAAVRMEGMKICSGQCQGKAFQETVELQVYSLPDTLQLDAQPKVPTAGQPAHLSCRVSHVYPPDAFVLSWFRGDERVEHHVEEDTEDSESDLVMFRSELEIPVAAGQTTYRCEAMLRIGQRLFRQSRTVTIQAQEMQQRATTIETASLQAAITTDLWGTPERPVPTADGKSSLAAITRGPPALRSTERPTVLTPAAATTAAPAPESLGRAPRTGSPSAAAIPMGEALAASSRPTAGISTSAGKDSTWTSTPAPETFAAFGVASTALPATDQPPATELVSTANGLPTLRSAAAAAKGMNHTVSGTPAPEGPCRPVITPFPAQGTVGGALRITCHALECRRGIHVQWVETPVAQSQYRQEKTEGQAALVVDRVSSGHQGVYRCVAMSSQPRVASVRVVVAPAAPFSTNTVITLGMAGSLLGLFVASYVSRRVWQRHGS